MKCLLKIGNINAIKKFAMQARTAKIYILGANYLQNADWHSDAQLMKTIISFYTKAKAFEELSGFYDACAQVEIDEYREYEKAIGAMKEALKHLLKSNAIDKDNKVLNLQTRIQIINDFVNARNLTQTNPQEMLRICTNILQIVSIFWAFFIFGFL
jgi:intraflagellar transport protein 140